MPISCVSFQNKIQNFFYKLTTSNAFEIMIVVIIVLNMFTMMIDHYNMSSQLIDIQKTINIVFTAIFTLEVIMKLIGFTWYYFKIPWNVFDFIVVVMSILGECSISMDTCPSNL